MTTKYFQFPFAEDGNRQAVPDTSAGTDVSYQFGYTPAYELPKTNPDRRNIDRRPFNGVLNDITANIKHYQENLYPEIVADKGDGLPLSYPIGFVGQLDGVYYEAIIDGTTTLPPSDDWVTYQSSNDLKKSLAEGSADVGGVTAAELAIFSKSFVPVMFPSSATPAQRTAALTATANTNMAILVPAGQYDPVDITQEGRVFYFAPGAFFKLPNGTSTIGTTTAISTFKVSAANIRAVGKIVVDGNLANNESSGVDTSDRRGAVHIAGRNFVFDKIESIDAHWVGFSVGSNVDAGTVVGNHVKIVNPRSYATSLWESNHNIELIEVESGPNSLDARIRTGSQTSSPEKKSTGTIGEIKTNDTVVIEANSNKLTLSSCIAKALKVEDSEDIGLPESLMLTGSTTEAFTFAVLSSTGVSWGTVNVRGHAGTNGVPAVRLSEVKESGGTKISVKGTIANVSDVDMRSAKDVAIGVIECLDPVGTGRGFLFDYDAGYAPQENIRIGNITSRGHTALDIELQNYQNTDIIVGGINSDATTNVEYLKRIGRYNEGTVTVSLSPQTGSITLNSGQDNLAYTRIGNTVNVTGRISVSAVTSPTGILTLNGLPYPVANLTELGGFTVFNARITSLATPYTGTVIGQLIEGATSAEILLDNGTNTPPGLSPSVGIGTVLVVGITYFCD